jgi:Na+-transporting NADH:ubiquinone oxidoreductase subunit NqrD
MKQKIRELAEQAGFQSIVRGDHIVFDISTKENLKEFAELIVRECIQVSEAHAKDLESQPTDPLLEAYEDGVVNGIYEATEAIKEHFGVE